MTTRDRHQGANLMSKIWYAAKIAFPMVVAAGVLAYYDYMLAAAILAVGAVANFIYFASR